MSNIDDLAKAKIVSYVCAVLYLIAFILLALGKYVIYLVMFLVIMCLIIVKIVYDWRFIIKTFKGGKRG